MKKYIYSFFLNILVASSIFNIFQGVVLPTDIVLAILTFLAISIAVMLNKPVLRFLTVKNNFITYWLIVTLLVFGAFFALSSVMPGFSISNTTIPSMDFQIIKIASFEMNTILTMIFASMGIAFVSALLEFTNTEGE